MAFEHQKTRKVIKLDQLNIFHVKCVIEYFDLNQEGLAIIFSNLFVNDFMDFELHRTTSSAEFQKKKRKGIIIVQQQPITKLLSILRS